MSQKCKREAWDKEETQYFLRLIHERQVLKRLDGKKFRAEEIFKHLEVPMHNRGYLKNAKQMQTRFKTSRFQFKSHKRKLRVSGDGNRRRDFGFYNEMEVLLGDRPVATLKGIDSATTETEVNATQEDNYEDLSLVEHSHESESTDPVSEPLHDAEREETAQGGTDDNETKESINTPPSRATPSPTTETPSQRGKTPKTKSKGGRPSIAKSLEKFAKVCQGNNEDLQREVNTRQENWMAQLVEKQQAFETELLTKFFDRQQTIIMKETTASLVAGLKSVLRPEMQKTNRHGIGCRCPGCEPNTQNGHGAGCQCPACTVSGNM